MFLCVSSDLFSILITLLGKRELVFVLIVHLFVSYAYVICVTLPLPPGIRGWGLAATSACGSSWTFLFTFLKLW